MKKRSVQKVINLNSNGNSNNSRNKNNCNKIIKRCEISSKITKKASIKDGLKNNCKKEIQLIDLIKINRNISTKNEDNVLSKLSSTVHNKHVAVQCNKPKLELKVEDIEDALIDTHFGNSQVTFRNNSDSIHQKVSNNSRIGIIKLEENIVSNQKDCVIDKGTLSTNSVSCQTEKCLLLSITNIKDNDKAMEFYTGLQNYEKFLYAFKTLGKDAYDLSYYYSDQQAKLTLLDEFLVTLILLRQHKSHYEISILFDITLKDIKNIFITWIRFMKLEWSNINLPQCYLSSLQQVRSTRLFIQSTTNERNMKEKVQNSDYKVDFCMEKNAQVIDLKNPDKTKSFLKAYKILSGPQNYIEKLLMNDIVFVCHVLCFFKGKKIGDLPRG